MVYISVEVMPVSRSGRKQLVVPLACVVIIVVTVIFVRFFMICIGPLWWISCVLVSMVVASRVVFSVGANLSRRHLTMKIMSGSVDLSVFCCLFSRLRSGPEAMGLDIVLLLCSLSGVYGTLFSLQF